MSRFLMSAREGLGRAPQAEEARTPQLPESVEAIETMSWQELQQLAGILLLDTFDDVPSSWRGGASGAGRCNWQGAAPLPARSARRRSCLAA
jgi:hypothetical protein